MLEARHLVKRFLGVTVVDDVSFIVRPGEVVGYLGPNGSGKTTTGRMLTGLVEHVSGHVYFDGHNIAEDLIAFRRRLGYVPKSRTSTASNPDASTSSSSAGCASCRTRIFERKIDALLELFGLMDAAHQSIASYSKGMKQKVLIIAALLHDPDATDLRRARLGARRDGDAGASSSGSRARLARQGDALQLARSRTGREAL